MGTTAKIMTLSIAGQYRPPISGGAGGRYNFYLESGSEITLSLAPHRGWPKSRSGCRGRPPGSRAEARVAIGD